MVRFRSRWAIWLIVALLSWSPATAWGQSLPNIVIIYADDLGYGDLACYNPHSAYPTPRLDRMAAEGIRFLDAHSPCTICSPSRYGLLSGNLVGRTGRRPTAFEGPSGPSYLSPDQLTLAQMLQRQGYRTGVFGKWHLGLTWYDRSGQRLRGGFEDALRIDYPRSTPVEDGPQNRGFDVSFVTPNCPTTDPLYVYLEDGRVVEPANQRHRQENLPNPGGKWRWDNDEGWMAPCYRFIDADLLFYEKAAQFIDDHRARFSKQPFFLILATQIAHAPVLPAEEFSGASGAGPRGDFVVELDTLTGRLLDLLARLEMDNNTLVIFNSDNGPETVHTAWMRQDHGHDPAGGYRGMKRDGWESGHRVPLIARWPAKIPPGLVSRQLANTTDLFATLASVVGFDLPDEVAVDSFDLLPVMVGQQAENEPIRPYMLTQSFRGEYQLRQGKWKYLDHQGSGGNDYESDLLREFALPETAPEARGQLFDLDQDPGETKNLYFIESAQRQQMQTLLQELQGKSGRTAPRTRRALGLDNLPSARQP